MTKNLIQFLLKERKNIPLNSFLKKSYLFRKFKKDKLELQLYQIVNYILVYLSLILLPKQVLSNYIEIKVNQTGEQQVLSDEFRGAFPSSIYLDNVRLSYESTRIQVDFTFSIIKL